MEVVYVLVIAFAALIVIVYIVDKIMERRARKILEEVKRLEAQTDLSFTLNHKDSRD